ncbi:zeta-crystallin-like isoform X1 [Schistocerca gregaria]|uniref:zeta-crystallin-like isoform X1 n=1 Tax=Schistocerca gregaria TaxID=7010 RepID=UPI00211F4630|nr:zeta-crystallin-like isoform X1 [Schistocerca gregaria]XP_049829523.1 zeta-crystallin-like isoform X1 [Schistocerca gregaria]
MKAVRIHKFGSKDALKLETVPIPEVGESEVLVRVNAAGINPVDTYIREGSFAVLPTLPAILGKEAAGVVEKVGDGVQGLKEGDRVFTCLPDNGGYAEYVTCKKNYVFPLSERLSFSQGAGLYVPYFTAYRALVTKCRIKPGEVLLIHGASGAVGIAALQLAKACGVSVVGTAGTLEGMELVKSLGADFVFNHKEKGYLNNAVAAIGGQGFNVVLENLANINLGADLTVLNQQARVAVVGSRGSVEVNPRSLMLTESTIIGVKLMGNTEEEHLEAAGVILKGIEDGWVKPIIAKEYALEEASQAHHDIIHNKGARGKLVFKV